MKLIFYPFFSQQDKREGKFLVGQDSPVRVYSYMAQRAIACGHQCSMVLPQSWQCTERYDPPCPVTLVPYKLAVDNVDRRLQWEPSFLRTLDADIIVCNHEFMPYPLKCLLPKTRVLLDVQFHPDTAYPETRALFGLARDAADALFTNTQAMAAQLEHKRVHMWPFLHNIGRVSAPPERDIDVMFSTRCSATNYTHHEEFLRAAEDMRDLRVVVADPTSYLRPHPLVPPQPYTRAEYVTAMLRSRVCVALVDGGAALCSPREAAACGCTMVTLDTPEYRELLGPDWPYYCTLDTVADTVRRALAEPIQAPIDAVARCSYERAWWLMKEDLGL